MADVLKFDRKARKGREEVPAALRAFIDDVLVPALVREYLAEMNVSKNLAPPLTAVSDSSSNPTNISEVHR